MVHLVAEHVVPIGDIVLGGAGTGAVGMLSWWMRSIQTRLNERRDDDKRHNAELGVLTTEVAVLKKQLNNGVTTGLRDLGADVKELGKKLDDVSAKTLAAIAAIRNP